MLRIVVQNDILVLVASSAQREGAPFEGIWEFVIFFFVMKNINENWKFIPTNFKEIETKLIKTNRNTISSPSNLIHLPTQTQFTFHFAP